MILLNSAIDSSYYDLLAQYSLKTLMKEEFLQRYDTSTSKRISDVCRCCCLNCGINKSMNHYSSRQQVSAKTLALKKIKIFKRSPHSIFNEILFLREFFHIEQTICICNFFKAYNIFSMRLCNSDDIIFSFFDAIECVLSNPHRVYSIYTPCKKW